MTHAHPQGVLPLGPWHGLALPARGYAACCWCYTMHAEAWKHGEGRCKGHVEQGQWWSEGPRERLALGLV